MTKRCSECGKKVRVCKDGTIGQHISKTLSQGSDWRDDHYVTLDTCPGAGKAPWKGKYYRKVGYVRY